MTNRDNFRGRVLTWALLATTGLGLTACSDDDGTNYPTVDNAVPTITLSSDHIQIEPGHTFTISGVAKDADGLKSIKLKNADLYLDKTIDLLAIYPDTLLHEYNLAYSYDSGNWQEKDEYNVEVSVEDVVGNTASATVRITPDGDNTAPTFSPTPSSTVSLSAQSPTFTVETTVADNMGLKYVTYLLTDAQDTTDVVATDSIAVSGLTYDFKKTVELDTRENSYKMTLTACDGFGNITTATSTVSVSADFTKMYLADVSTAADLTSDVYGVPMLIEHTGKNEYRARYYNQKAGTEIRFIPQKTAFTPTCFGLDDNGKIVNDPNAKPIVLDEVAYYEITFNTSTGEYSKSTYKPTDEPFPQGEMFTENGIEQPYLLSLAGSGLPGADSWSTSKPFVLTQDANNKYLFYGDMELKAGTDLEFTITPKSESGWWPEPFWRFESGENDSKENEYNTKNNGNNMTKMTVKTSGKYRFEFDTHLLRSRIYPHN